MQGVEAPSYFAVGLVGDYGGDFAGRCVTCELDGPVANDGDVGFVGVVVGVLDCVCGAGVAVFC